MSMTVAPYVAAAGWTFVLAMLSLALPAMAWPKNTTSSRRRDSHSGRVAWGAVLAFGIALIAVGLLLWLPHAGDSSDANSDLGAALLGAAIVPFALFVLDKRFESIAADRAADEAERRRADELRNYAQIVTALSTALPGIDLSGRDLSRFYLSNKDLPKAELESANLTRAQLEETNLDGANLSHAVLVSAFMTGSTLRAARLEAARLSGANLTGADLTGAILTGADLSGDTQLADADLDRAQLEGADLRGANLESAKNLHTCKLAGARYEAAPSTSWPAGFDPDRAGAVRLESNDEWQPTALKVRARVVE
jgi:uncharacterized protein YjbI with pentapeptide repeats